MPSPRPFGVLRSPCSPPVENPAPRSRRRAEGGIRYGDHRLRRDRRRRVARRGRAGAWWRRSTSPWGSWISPATMSRRSVARGPGRSATPPSCSSLAIASTWATGGPPGEPLDPRRPAGSRDPGPGKHPGRAPAGPGCRRQMVRRAETVARAETAAGPATRRPWSWASPALERPDTVARLAPLDLAEVPGDAGGGSSGGCSAAGTLGGAARRVRVGGAGL